MGQRETTEIAAKTADTVAISQNIRRLVRHNGRSLSNLSRNTVNQKAVVTDTGRGKINIINLLNGGV